jgi:diguanylate cyclase (GGDEF)-like protein
MMQPFREYAEHAVHQDSPIEHVAKDELAQLRARVAAQSEELEKLYAALDQVDQGIMLLDQDMRVQFLNRAIKAFFDTPPNLAAGKPSYEDLLQDAIRTKAYAVSSGDLKKYVARRLARVRAGDPTPMDQRLSSGKIIRSHCAVLPAGGRMLTYSNVTDLVQHAEQLERLATTDGMTGIFNRRHFLALADREWRRSKRYQRPLSLLMIDIDLFKSINDRFGHEMGDQVIMRLASIARERKRDSDVLARIGGEEFALLLPETDLQQAHIVAERLREDVARTPLVAAQGVVPTTISIGVATTASHMSGIADLMKSADQALYDAKNAGRNRVVCNAEAVADAWHSHIRH